ncbi:hypothetical protein L1S32_05970 [Methanogenium sp. S4BF]|uniref:hypothetical protein n=1 Tax=Methanogenium sp. S4BF TaxID=1789226 RepID=UPI0024162178|nr:hypothetical protein [Methanogenium sp. S4BF]WFN35645.1 hypothetical protein L1S32_05970 [Methanogenium sp. S4BF]
MESIGNSIWYRVALQPYCNTRTVTIYSPYISDCRNRCYQFYRPGTTHATWSGNGGSASYVSFGRALGYMDGVWQDVHGAGAQRSDPKAGDASDYPEGHGPQGDAIRIENFVRLVRR